MPVEDWRKSNLGFTFSGEKSRGVSVKGLEPWTNMFLLSWHSFSCRCCSVFLH